ncbi:nickel-dependent hydrogenase large subunit [Paenibacillus sp. SEL3]|uniref:Nickel-dependent hydrogenase large subunit n=1 Tax=Paenibacillus polymyxa TaxID=1406 RepID=A0A8I1LPP4_PAEPO|nr:MULTISPECIES: nickel-dependent hydrogenase large subunit [Paenibacillus]KAF6575293.1 nickel-dependent hydrogenase large subunit [Paenibacillus sp. EKM206P]KAF6590034.1 nickel-dependent hydrogenase large subunit [Paenibacillus sp. EKM205P]MBM0632621.1 nickel-dependent hydrogenase large subunit [Paenibacillus polymyxa]
MTKRIKINPLTRISGFMEMDVTLEGSHVVDAKTKGVMFRGFEQMMVDRSPFDAIYLTQRICGICSTAHSVAASVALEDALHIVPTEQGRYLRDIIHACEFIQNHLRHFYQYGLPDFVNIPKVTSIYTDAHSDFRLPSQLNELLASHYFESLPISRLGHQLLALFGGKAPHNHGIFVGGYSTPATTDRLVSAKSILVQIKDFVLAKMLPDAYVLARYYDDYFHIGAGPRNLMTYGLFNNYLDLGTLYVDSGVYREGHFEQFDRSYINEHIDYSWYEGTAPNRPFENMPEPDMNKEQGYTWVKAPRYKELPYEVGPLARLWISGEYRHGISTMDRILARCLEVKKVIEVTEILLDQVIPDTHVQQQWQVPDESQGEGLVDTTRGALGHWVKLDNKKISFYQIITPSAWDFSASTATNKGTAEQALIGTRVANPDDPIELGRILRSFDPCMSCATHVHREGHAIQTFQVMG